MLKVKEISRIVGYKPPEDFLKAAKDALGEIEEGGEDKKVEKKDEGVKFIEGTLDDALKLSKESNKPIMIDFYTDWCGWCKVLDEKSICKKRCC